MKDFIYRKKEVPNPVLEMGIKYIENGPHSGNNTEGVFESLIEEGYTIYPVYSNVLKDQSNKLYTERICTKKKECENVIAVAAIGAFAFPEDFNMSEKSISYVYELFTAWSNGEVFEIMSLDNDIDLLEDLSFHELKATSDISYKIIQSKMSLDQLVEINPFYKKILDYSKEKNLNTDHFSLNHDFYKGYYQEFFDSYTGFRSNKLFSEEDLENKKWFGTFYGLKDLSSKILEDNCSWTRIFQ